MQNSLSQIFFFFETKTKVQEPFFFSQTREKLRFLGKKSPNLRRVIATATSIHHPSSARSRAIAVRAPSPPITMNKTLTLASPDAMTFKAPLQQNCQALHINNVFIQINLG